MRFGRNTKNLYKDIRDFIKLQKTIKKHSKTSDWTRFNLRADWIGRIYTVFNPMPEDKGDSSEVIKIKIGERILPCHKYIYEIGLGDIVTASAEQIPETDSYLVVYYQLYRYFSLWKLVQNLLFILIIVFTWRYVVDLFIWLFSLLS